MQKNILVSIIIPLYNGEKYIVETISSVLSQSYQNIEIIVVNDGSTDHGPERVRAISDRRIKIYDIHNSGRPAVPRNVGINKCSGDFVAFLDQDDIWFKNKLEKQLLVFKKRTDILAVSTNMIQFPQNKVKGILAFRSGKLFLFRDKVVSFKFMIKKSIICGSSIIIKRKIFDEIGLLDETKDLRAVEDYDYWLRLLDYQDRSIYVMKEVLVGYRLHDNSTSKLDTIHGQDKKISLIFNKYIEKYPTLIAKAGKRLSL